MLHRAAIIRTMNFGIWSNGFRPHTSADESYEEDLYEIVLADELGFAEAWISEHHAEPLYMGAVDVLPCPELLMCKAAALTKQIKLGASVKVIHLTHPVDVALQVATADNVIGGGRYMFGFGAGFPNPLFAKGRGLSHEDRHERTMEALEMILQCWRATEPFDWHGKHWQGRDIVVLPKPLQQPHMTIATATASLDTLALAGERGYKLLTAGGGTSIRASSDTYARAAVQAGRDTPLADVIVSASIYVADSVEEGIEDLRDGVEFELGFQRERGLLAVLARYHHLPDSFTFDDLVDAGIYIVGDPDSVTYTLSRLYEESGGFGTLLYRVGKGWAPRAKIERSMRRFASEVAPRLARLQPADRSFGS